MEFPKRGEIWLVVLDPIVGSEIGKTRPALVISNNRNNEFSNTITILPISSKTQEVYPFEVFLSKEEEHLSLDSKIKCNQIRTVDKRRLIKLLGKVTEEKLKEVDKALLIHLGMWEEGIIKPFM
ncbi:MAG TPA: type II toxin-antitoxin system PemK/MazF family toxin [Dictyoglomaceae bacterium]|nr:type II toxin-antitoxin system PemK/MazF family toxin [Dictyoglomaceae bacterium]HPU44324.1 type II toxin-antitoxin system PemK/MazF family toxin [Dictyoglomaceae bacterium]